MFFKKLHHWFLVLFLFGLGFSFVPAYSYTDKIIAVVNDDVITQSEVRKRAYEQKQQMMRANVSLPSDQELQRRALNDLIDRSLVLQIAKRNNFEASNKDVDAAITDVAKHNHLTIPQLQQELQKMGMSFKDYRKNIKNEITIHRVQQQAVAGKVIVSDKDVADYMHKAKAYNAAANETTRVRAYHVVDILLPIASDVSEQKKQVAQKVISLVIDRLREGKTPAQIAQDTKVDGLALEVNDLGMRKSGDLPDIFASTVANLKKGEVAGPITAPNGLHVIKVLEVEDLGGGGARAMNFTEDDARQMAFRNKFAEALKPWMRQLRSTAYVKIMDPDYEQTASQSSDSARQDENMGESNGLIDISPN